jgi:hypothetical protein
MFCLEDQVFQAGSDSIGSIVVCMRQIVDNVLRVLRFGCFLKRVTR